MNKLWDDVVAGPQPDGGHGSGMFKKKLTVEVDTNNLNISKATTATYGEEGGLGIGSSGATPTTPTTASPRSGANVWRSVFHPGSNLNTRSVGAHYFDKPVHSTSPSPTTYDWLYSDETKSKYA